MEKFKPTYVRADNLRFGDVVWHDGYQYQVFEAELNRIGTINVWLKPTDQIGLDIQAHFHPGFMFYLYDRI